MGYVVNIVQPGRPQMKIWRMRIACGIPKTTIIHSEYNTLIAFPLQLKLHGRDSVSRYSIVHLPFCTSVDDFSNPMVSHN